MIIDQYTNSTIDELKRSRDVLVSVLREAGCTLIKGNAIRCPFCDDKNPSAGIYEPNGHGFSYKCHKCGKNGSVIDVISWADKISTEEVIRKLRKPEDSIYPKKKVFSTIEEVQEAVIKTTHCDKIENVYKYTNPDTNKIDMVVFRCKTGSEKTFRPACPVADGYIMESPPVPRPIYNRLRVRSSLSVVIVEGEKCVHALNELGIVATTSPGGWANGRYANWTPLYNKEVIIWPDNDEPGKKYAADVENILSSLEYPPKISIIEPSDLDLQEKEDAADYIEQIKLIYKEPEERYQSIKVALAKAKSKSYAYSLSKDYQDIINGNRRPVHFPHSALTILSSALMPKTITMLCGNPGASKSLLLLQWIGHWVDTGIKSIVCELEKDRNFHLRRSHAQKACCSELTDNEWIETNKERVSDLCIEHEGFLDMMGGCIYDGNEAQSNYTQILDWIIEKAKIGYRVIAIDPITILDSAKETFKEQQKFIQGLNDKVIRQYNCSIILVVHPTKGAAFPDLGSLAGSTAFSRFVDTVFWLDIHDKKTSKVDTCVGTENFEHNRTIYILKSRNGKGGGYKIAYTFDNSSLTLKEHGIILKN